jgi:hypothetical protein
MKKFFGILFMLTLFTAVPAAAQVDWGIKAGVNIAEKPSNLDDVMATVKGKAGWYVGPMIKATIPVVGLGVEANLLYSQTNTEVHGTTIKRQSIDLPVYLRYELSIPAINKFIEPFIAAGPQWSWNIGDDKFSWTDAAINGIYGQEYLADYTLRSSNLTLNVGLGAVLLNHIQLHINYNIALGDTGEWKEDASSAGWGYIKGSKVNTWQVSAAYIF